MPVTRSAGLTVVLAVTASALAGCASGGESAPPAGRPAQPAGDPAIAVSPGGVTTEMNVPAESTEEQYAKACMAAKDWMLSRGGDPKALVEPFLADVQASGTAGPATFQTTWADLSDPQRSAVIIAVRAAADGGC